MSMPDMNPNNGNINDVLRRFSQELERQRIEIERLKTQRIPYRDWLETISCFMGLRALRGFWPLSSTDNTGAVYDLSEQGRTLTNTNVSISVLDSGLPYAIFNGTSSILQRADDAGLDITGALTFGGWFYLDSIGGTVALMSKASAVPQSSFQIAYQATVPVGALFQITPTGSAPFTVVSGNGSPPISAATWTWIIARYTPSSEMAIFVNSKKTINTTSIPASIFNSTAPFYIGGNDAGSRMPGRSGLNFLCASALSDAVIQNLYNRTRGLFP